MALFAFNQSYVAVAVMVTALAVGQHAFYRSLNGQLVANASYFLSFSKDFLNKSLGLLDDLVHVALSKFETKLIHYRRIVIYSIFGPYLPDCKQRSFKDSQNVRHQKQIVTKSKQLRSRSRH